MLFIELSSHLSFFPVGLSFSLQAVCCSKEPCSQNFLCVINLDLIVITKLTGPRFRSCFSVLILFLVEHVVSRLLVKAYGPKHVQPHLCYLCFWWHLLSFVIAFISAVLLCTFISYENFCISH